jgi:hypothetical protein
MHEMYKLKDMLCEELEKITKKGELSAGSLDAVDKLTHSIKSIDTIIAMDEYSEDDGMSYDGSYGGSYARGGNRGGGNRGNSNARGRRRDSMGRYSRNDGYRYSYGNGGNYSREAEMDNLKMELQGLLEEAENEEERKMIRKWIKQVAE